MSSVLVSIKIKRELPHLIPSQISRRLSDAFPLWQFSLYTTPRLGVLLNYTFSFTLSSFDSIRAVGFGL